MPRPLVFPSRWGLWFRRSPGKIIFFNNAIDMVAFGTKLHDSLIKWISTTKVSRYTAGKGEEHQGRIESRKPEGLYGLLVKPQFILMFWPIRALPIISNRTSAPPFVIRCFLFNKRATPIGSACASARKKHIVSALKLPLSPSLFLAAVSYITSSVVISPP